MANWAELIQEMLFEICKRVASSEDLIAFGGVCSMWRHVALKQNMGLPLLPFPWLMLAENQDDDVREFYSVTEGKNYRFELPELRGKKCMETKGWIVTASDKGEMALVHPLTRVTIPLPHQNTSKCYYEHPMEPLMFVERVVLSSPPDPKNERDCVIVILHGGMGDIGFCRLGDKEWTVVENNVTSCGIQALEYYRGKFYIVNNHGEVWEYDVIGKSNDTNPFSPRRIKVIFFDYLRWRQPYLVESAGSLLVVFRDGSDASLSEFWVLEIDLEHERLKHVSSLGTRSIFLGHSATLSVDTIFYPELIPNSIYFTDDCYENFLNEPEGAGKNMGVYNLEDKSVRPHYSGKSLSFVCPPIWTFLTSR